MNRLHSILPLFGALVVAQAASAQPLQYSEVRTNLPQGSFFAPTTITDSGDILILTYGNGPAGYFLHNGNLNPIAYQPFDILNYANTLETVVGFSAITGNGFVQDRAGNRTALVGPSNAGFYPTGINRKGIVVGQDNLTGLSYLYQNGAYKLFQNASGPLGILNINDFGDTCGGNFIITRDGTMITLNLPATSTAAQAYAINNRDQVVGNITLNGPTYSTNVGFLAGPRGQYMTVDASKFGPPAYPGAKGVLLVNPKSSQTFVWGLNNFGQIAGQGILVFSDGAHTSALDYGFIGGQLGGP